MDLSGVISSLASGTYAITREAAGTWTNGRYVAGSTSSFNITASIQPAKGRDLLRLPEGQRTTQAVSVFTATALRTAAAPAGPKADLVSYQGASYEVSVLEPWNENGNFYKALAVKVGQ